MHKAAPEIGKAGGSDFGLIHYSEKRPPAWFNGDNINDLRHHLIAVVAKGSVVALAFSDTAQRRTIITDIRRGQIPAFRQLAPVTAKQINDAFVGEKVRTLWLNAAHQRVSTKADSKVLSGLELEAALDPLDDQTYYFSSVRSTPELAKVAADKPAPVIGANPRNARVWIGPSKDWADFLIRVEALLDATSWAISKPKKDDSPLPVLARPIYGIPAARTPYDMAIIVPEAISAGAEDSDEDAWLHEFSDAVRFEIVHVDKSPSFTAEVFWGKERYGKIAYNFVADKDGEANLKSDVVEWSNDAEHRDDIKRICRDSELLTIHFDTGHTFARGLFYETRFRDAAFAEWSWIALKGFDLDTEKPLTGRKLNIKGIGEKADISLFGYVAKHWPNFTDAGRPTGWLVCDDGSMESADFVHFDAASKPPSLTLVHVKGSNSASAARSISVSDYEVVVGQAVKNLRYLDRVNVHEKLASNRSTKIGSAIWKDGVRQKNRDGFLKALKNAGSNMRKVVCVLQPSARLSQVESARKLIAAGSTVSSVRRLQQLDTLLLGARRDCLALGADFLVIGHDDRV
ncbi:MAG TPA: hypothetical protein VMF90_13990 [Rhizobiaceae bacterium]|nr:hypothetical protein [Rhizobiaceae bacterium]